MEAPACPICGDVLKVTGANPNMYSCVKRKIWVSDLGEHMEVIDAAIYLSPEGKHLFEVIEIPPYIFSIKDDETGRRTEIIKAVPVADVPWRKMIGRGYERKLILTIPAAVKLPWNDKQKVMERVKLYLLFS